MILLQKTRTCESVRKQKNHTSILDHVLLDATLDDQSSDLRVVYRNQAGIAVRRQHVLRAAELWLLGVSVCIGS